MAKGRPLALIPEFSFEEGFWARPTYDGTKAGEGAPNRIFEAVGHALTEWERAEECLYYLHSIVCGVPSSSEAHDIVMRSFGTTESTMGRITAVRAAATMYFDPWWHIASIRDTVDELFNGAQKAAQRRNEIAHGKVTGVRTFVKDGAPVELDTGYLLLAPRYMSGRTNAFPSPDPLDIWSVTKSHYGFNSSDVEVFADKFTRLASVFADFANQSTTYSSTGDPHFIQRFLKANPNYSARRRRRSLGPP